MAIEINGSMTGNELKTQLEKIATKGELCSNLTTSFKDVSNPICTLGDMSGANVQFWVSLLVQSLYCWEDNANDYIDTSDKKIPMGFSTTNRILDMFKTCNTRVGRILYEFAKLLGNNFSVFPLSNLCACDTFNDIFSSNGATDDICSFYPLFSMVDYMYGEEIENAAATFNSKIFCIKDGWFWNGYKIQDGYRPGTNKCLCGVYSIESEPYCSDKYSVKNVYPVDDSHCTHEDGGVKISNSGFFIFSGFSCFKHVGMFSSKSSSGYRYSNVISSIIDGAAGSRYTYINFDTNPVESSNSRKIEFDINGNKYYKLGGGCKKYQNAYEYAWMCIYPTGVGQCSNFSSFESSVDSTGVHVTGITLDGGSSEFNSIGIMSCNFGLNNLYYTIGKKI